ncbi:hypothetical protein AJ78_03156 [Emergomyces pasteurianus Ep9510]|uniref:Glycosyl hydrolase family 43 protein n=1 Tax=Emergomyces pasteurianus Ep9510 TaxID=1447872 RepID=A0A1J9PKS5_9EURO|nr:hypothetical protein AJ78_03156 [Emergomyces pasteurianus Ep9510]
MSNPYPQSPPPRYSIASTGRSSTSSTRRSSTSSTAPLQPPSPTEHKRYEQSHYPQEQQQDRTESKTPSKCFASRCNRPFIQRVLNIFLIFSVTLFAVSIVHFLIDFSKRRDSGMPRKVLANFPDPGLLAYNGTWYAFGTNPTVNDDDDDTKFHVPVAMPVGGSDDRDGGFFGEWKHTGRDALPEVAMWETKRDHWAPDVITKADGRHLLYYSGEIDIWRHHHCIGVAVSESTDPVGPYKPEGTYLTCPLEYGGGIHPSAIIDADGTIYIVYKGDGNSMNRNSGNCSDATPPFKPTPLLLQKMKPDGTRLDGEPVQILDRLEKEDGPLIEAPNLVRSADGVYFLFYSSHCSESRDYDVKYATAREIAGPYTRAKKPLLKSGDFGLVSPGGATVSKDGKKIVFHADCAEGRCMWVGAIELKGTDAKIIRSAS